MSRSPNHACPRPAPAGLDARLHHAQAGDARQRCVGCAYWAGFAAGEEAASDQRRSSWPADNCERCIAGNAAPRPDLLESPRSQGDARHLCATCAWVHGWCDSVSLHR